MLFVELPVVRQIKERYQKTQDAKACGDDMPQCLEKTLLLGIVRHGKTLAALQTVSFLFIIMHLVTLNIVFRSSVF